MLQNFESKILQFPWRCWGFQGSLLYCISFQLFSCLLPALQSVCCQFFLVFVPISEGQMPQFLYFSLFLIILWLHSLLVHWVAWRFGHNHSLKISLFFLFGKLFTDIILWVLCRSSTLLHFMIYNVFYHSPTHVTLPLTLMPLCICVIIQKMHSIYLKYYHI